MGFIELEIEGVKASAKLLEDSAPLTCQAFLRALPFESMCVHSRWSGGRLHTGNLLNLGIDISNYPDIENPSSYQAPGDIVFEPITGELNVVYAPGNYRWMGAGWPVTKIGIIEGDFSSFARKIERLQWEGTKKLVINQGKQLQILSPEPQGVRIKIECGNQSWVAELFDERTPILSAAVLKTLPIRAYITNMHSSGNIFHVWHPIPNYPKEVETKRERPPVDFQNNQIGSTAIAFYNPREARGTFRGDILCDDTEGLRIVHGEVQSDMSQFTSNSKRTQKIGHIISGNLDALHEISNKIDSQGAQIMKIIRME